MGSDTEPAGRDRTSVICPRCGKRTGTSVATGDVLAYCRRCNIEIEVIIHVVEKDNQQPRG